MPVASEIEPVAPGVILWRFYDPAVKADLFSTAITSPAGTYLVDPIPLAPEANAQLHAGAAVVGIIVTNENHERAAGRFAEEFRVPIHLHPALLDGTVLQRIQPIQDHSALAPGLLAIPIDGAPPGEIAVYSNADGGTLIIGDALINFEPHGFGFLPARYCSNAKRMRRSLPRLLDYSFERMLFAHGTPILKGARRRLEDLLQQG